MRESACSIESIAEAVRNYDGVKRKLAIGRLVQRLKIPSEHVVASFGEDAAVITTDAGRDDVLLLAADGIWSRLMEVDPYWAGYCSILVNIHDIAAMGGRPVALVDIFSMCDCKIGTLVTKGMHDASQQFGVPVVGGHVHPDADVNSIGVAVLGVAQSDGVIYSTTAEDGDVIIAAYDLEGRVHPSSGANWDSVTMKDAAFLRAQIAIMQELGEKKLVTAGKDISNPGLLGTLGMLLEVSRMGAVVDIERIPSPPLAEHGITLVQWLMMYPGMGFILTAHREHVDAIISCFSSVSMCATVIGEVNASKKLEIRCGDSSAEVFDFVNDDVTGIERCYPDE
ncbi:MAG: methanogenesis marker 2 protein [Methanomicrobiales archaeon]|jgi:putative methanogenesis marker protein 2|nr:methanogenesis marker 2 protein [Methanomicrobiales archaeon]